MADTFILLAQRRSTNISSKNIAKFRKNVKFYLPDKRIPRIGTTATSSETAARQWISGQPGLKQPQTCRKFKAAGSTIIMFIIEQDWQRSGGRPSDWVTGWTAVNSRISQVRTVIRQAIQELGG